MASQQRSEGPKNYPTEPPLEKIAQANERYGANFPVLVCIARRRIGGDGGLYPWLRQNIHAPLRAVTEAARSMSELLAGGGTFRVTVLYVNEQNQKQVMLPEWLEVYEGIPKELPEGMTMAWDDLQDSGNGRFIAVEKEPGARSVASAPGPSGRATGAIPAGAPLFPRPVLDASGRLSAPPENLVGPWARGYEPQIQWQLAADAYQHQWGVRPDLTPTGIAMQWTASEQRRSEGAEVKAVRAEERLETVRGNAQAVIDAERSRSAAIERELAETKAKHERDIAEARAQAREDKLLAKIEAIESRVASGGGARQQSSSAAELAAIAAPFVPVLVEMVKPRADPAIELMRATLTKPAEKSMLEAWVPLIGAAAPIAGPLLLKWLENMSPEARSDLVEKQQMQNQILLKQVWDMIQSSVPKDTPMPWWLPPLEGMLKEMMGLANTALIGASMRPPRQLPPAQQNQPLPKEIDVRQGAPAQQGIAGAAAEIADQAADDARQAAPPTDTSGSILAPQANLTALVHRLGGSGEEGAAQAAMFTGAVVEELSRLCGEGKVDPLFLTPEWVTIIFTMHRKVDPEELAAEIADHLEHCRQFYMLPQVLGEVFDKPALMGVIVEQMPVAKFDAQYAKLLVEAIVEEVSGRETERKKVEAEMEAEDDEDEKPAIAAA